MTSRTSCRRLAGPIEPASRCLLRRELVAQEAVTQGAADRTIGIALVGAHMTLQAHAESHGDALAGEVGIVTPETDALGIAVVEQGADGGCCGLARVALLQMGLVAEVSYEIAGQVGVADADVDLCDKGSVIAAEGAEKGRAAGLSCFANSLMAASASALLAILMAALSLS